MIQNLHISNFQSHKDTTLAFSPGVNVITGASDSGKTAIIRALRWLIWNRPGGEDFRSDWGGDTEVMLELDDHTKIHRRKDKENLYAIGKTAQDHEELKAFGTKVPEEIQKALNIDDTNLQKQFDSPFLISSSPGEVAAYFNKVAHLEKIDSSVSYVNGQILSLTAQHKADQVTLDENREELKQYDYIPKFEIDLEELEHQQSAYIQQITSRNKLRIHLEIMAENEKEIEKQEKITELEEPVDEILRLYEERESMVQNTVALVETLLSIKDNTIQAIQLSKKAELLPQVEELLKLNKEWDDLCLNRHSLRESIREITNISKQQTEYEVLIEEKEKLFHEHMPDLCPLCGNQTT